MMNTIKFYEGGKSFLISYEYENIIVPHIGTDIVICEPEAWYYVTDVSIIYKGDQQTAIVSVKKINELD